MQLDALLCVVSSRFVLCDQKNNNLIYAFVTTLFVTWLHNSLEEYCIYARREIVIRIYHYYLDSVFVPLILLSALLLMYRTICLQSKRIACIGNTVII